MRNHFAGLAAILLGTLLGCGDNSRQCGPGTIEEGGACLPAAMCGFGTTPDPESGECVPDGSVVCTDGTVFDVLTGTCMVDASACQNGTVLINGACVDPTAGLVVHVQEGPEPNGLGVLEASLAQAGNIALPSAGSGESFVIHGTINPHRDDNEDGALDPDVDTYVLTVAAPTFVRITADGVNGTAAGFLAVAVASPGDPLEGWERVGLSLVSDTSMREVLLPAAGTYYLAIADTRTLVEYVTSGTAHAAPGGDTSEYYVSLTTLTAPIPTDLQLSNGTLSTTLAKPSDALAVFRVPLGTGLNRVRLAMPSPHAEAALVVLAGGDVHTSVEGAGPASALVGGVDEGEEALVVVDHVYSLLPGNVTYTLDVSANDATVLSTTGDTVTATATANNGSDFSRLNMFALDVSQDDASLGVDITFDIPVVGQLYDTTGELAAAFTSPTTTSTWTSYRGLVRLARAGRYYLAVFAPSATSSTVIGVTSTLAELEPAEIPQGTPTTEAIGAFQVIPLRYDAGTTDPWQELDVTGTNTGGQHASWFDPAAAYGRLDTLATSAGSSPGVPPLFAQGFPPGGGAIGRIVLADPTQTYYVKVNALAPTTDPTVTLTFDPRRDAADLGTLASGTGTMRNGETLDATSPERFYLFRTASGNTAMITVTPTSNADTQFQRIDADETALGPLVNVHNGPAFETFTQNAAGWTAFVVSAVGPLTQPRTFDVAVQIQ